MNDGSNAVAVSRANLLERSVNRFIRADINVDSGGGRWWLGRTGAIETDDRVALAEPGDQGRGDKTARSGDEDDLRSAFGATRTAALDVGHTSTILLLSRRASIAGYLSKMRMTKPFRQYRSEENTSEI